MRLVWVLLDQDWLCLDGRHLLPQLAELRWSHPRRHVRSEPGALVLLNLGLDLIPDVVHSAREHLAPALQRFKIPLQKQRRARLSIHLGVPVMHLYQAWYQHRRTTVDLHVLKAVAVEPPLPLLQSLSVRLDELLIAGMVDQRLHTNNVVVSTLHCVPVALELKQSQQELEPAGALVHLPLRINQVKEGIKLCEEAPIARPELYESFLLVEPDPNRLHQTEPQGKYVDTLVPRAGHDDAQVIGRGQLARPAPTKDSFPVKTQAHPVVHYCLQSRGPGIEQTLLHPDLGHDRECGRLVYQPLRGLLKIGLEAL